MSDCIQRNYGITTAICSELDCSYKQLYNALDKYGLREELKQAKKQIIGLAEKAIVECLRSENESVKIRAAESTLQTLGRSEGWGKGPDVQIQQAIVSDKELAVRNIFGLPVKDEAKTNDLSA